MKCQILFPLEKICMKCQILFSGKETICMKCQILFFKKNNKNILSVCHLLNLPREVVVKCYGLCHSPFRKFGVMLMKDKIS